MLNITTLGHLMKNRGRTSTMQTNVTQNTASLWNTERSPGEREKSMKDIGIAFRCRPEKKTASSINCKFCFVFLPSGVKKIMDEMRKLKVSPETITQAITEPNRHHIITRPTPPTTPIRAVKASRTAGTDRGNMTFYRAVNMYHSS